MSSKCPIKRDKRKEELNKFVSLCLRDRSFIYKIRYNWRKWAHLVCKWLDEHPEYPWRPVTEMPPHNESVLAANFNYESTTYTMCVYNRHSKRFKTLDGRILNNVTHWAYMQQIDPLYE